MVLSKSSAYIEMVLYEISFRLCSFVHVGNCNHNSITAMALSEQATARTQYRHCQSVQLFRAMSQVHFYVCFMYVIKATGTYLHIIECLAEAVVEMEAEFEGDGYIELPTHFLPHASPLSPETIEFSVTTNEPDALLFWQGQPPGTQLRGSDYISVALEGGRVVFR